MKIFLVISIVIGIVDIIRMKEQEDYISKFPIGDIGYYVEPKRIMGLHNIIFFPSILIIILFKIVVRVINGLLE